jgi:hypothetical protein
MISIVFSSFVMTLRSPYEYVACRDDDDVDMWMFYLIYSSRKFLKPLMGGVQVAKPRAVVTGV